MPANHNHALKFDPLPRQSSLGGLAYDKLKDIIMRGAFPPNTKMTVRSVAAALEVSTTPARDAINRLLAEGALVNEGPKTVVLPALSLQTLDEITAVRLSLEGLAAEHSVRSVTKADIAALEALQNTINASLDSGNYAEVLRANQAFHFLVYQRSGWPTLVRIIETLWLRIGPSLNELYPEFAQTRKGVSNHMAVLEALRKKDARQTRAAIEQDLRDGYPRLKAMLMKQAEK